MGAITEFSADLSMTIANGKAMTGKVFVKGDKIRNEMSVMGQASITIARQDKRVTWLLMPTVQKYREMPMKYDPAHPTPDMPFETKEIGKGNANGYDCKLIQYKFKNPEYGIVVNWVAPKLNMPVRVEVKNKSGELVTTIDYTNIKIGPQAASLFEIPAGYTKMETK
jgi:outer membrane lipoprotein-sorting protein